MTDTQPCEVRNLSGKVIQRELGRQLHSIRADGNGSLAIGAHVPFDRIGRATRDALGVTASSLRMASATLMAKVDSLQTAASDVVRRVPVAEWSVSELIRREWLVTNGLGGYASGTLAGPPTRRYHSLLVAALPAPLGRLALLARLDERIRLSSRRVAWLSRAEPTSAATISDFRLVGGLPVWQYTFENVVLEKRAIHAQRAQLDRRHLQAGAGSPTVSVWD